jgi:hypothetical protein
MYGERERGKWLAAVGAAFLFGTGSAFTQLAGSHNGGGGGGAGESGTATHQHLDSRFSHNRYYYDRGYAVHTPPAGGVANLIGRNGEHYYFQGGNWYRWRGDWYRSWGGAWVVVNAPVGLLVPLLPPYYTVLWSSGTRYYYANETYYVWDAERNGYEVVLPPDTFKVVGVPSVTRNAGIRAALPDPACQGARTSYFHPVLHRGGAGWHRAR